MWEETIPPSHLKGRALSCYKTLYENVLSMLSSVKNNKKQVKLFNFAKKGVKNK